MKNISSLIGLGLVLLLATGCSDSTTSIPAPDPGGSQVWRGLTAKINTAAWSADNFAASRQSGYTTISATGSGDETIGITFPSVNFTAAETQTLELF
jgi:hypothetical protein